ncbi:MAG: beta-ketoacyl-[acyl-carrier-protein] synthase II [Nitrospirae bacterium RBG_13_43_8]|nr:MAG: beta-ketoacyl-[acyl-carrier-protein] synthase II [Nitrospirae bacterium RBG_13_43_8]
MNKKRVAVTGLGAITPVGNTVQEFWNALLEGRSGVKKIQSFNPSRFSSQIAAEVLDFDPHEYLTPKEVRKTDRFVQFAIAASKKAVEDSKLNLDSEDRDRVGVIIGSGIGGLHTIESEHLKYMERGPEKGPSKISPFLIPMLIVNMAAGQVSICLKVKGPNKAVVTACATGNHAIGDAFRIIQKGQAEVMIAGGSEAAITIMGFGGFCSLKALSTRNDEPHRASRPFDRDRDGFIMGEGAGIVILEELEHAVKRNAPIYCEIIGYGMNADAYHMTAPDPDGEGAAKCLKMCLDDANLKPEDVDYINAHGTSTAYNDKIETLAIKKIFGEHARKLAISSTKSVIGHLLGAAGGVEAIACALAIKNNIAPPTINLENPDPECDLDYVPNKPRPMKIDVAISNSLGFGGHNATLAFRKYTP